jgi:hypothetical protein
VRQQQPAHALPEVAHALQIGLREDLLGRRQRVLARPSGERLGVGQVVRASQDGRVDERAQLPQSGGCAVLVSHNQ